MMAKLNNQDSRRVHAAGSAGFRRHSLFFIQGQGSDSRGSDRLREALSCSTMTRYVWPEDVFVHKPAFLITIDTEGDNLWQKHDSITTENARY
ncbi:MAG: deacetylase, partial [Klebsiella oxytoca]|nr:deacetylase [Klebsiella oxytoca]